MISGPDFVIRTSCPALKQVSEFSISSPVKEKKKSIYVDVMMDIFQVHEARVAGILPTIFVDVKDSYEYDSRG